MCVCTLHTPVAVGAADLDGRQVVEKFVEFGVADGRPPGVICAVVEPEPNLIQTKDKSIEKENQIIK